MICPKCKKPMQSRGTNSAGNRRYNCPPCGKSGTETSTAEFNKLQVKGSVADLVVRTSEVIKTVEDLIRVAQIDTKAWVVRSWEVTAWDSPRANKQQNLDFDGGKVTGKVRDEGKMTVVQLWRVNAKLEKNTLESQAHNWLAEFKKDLSKSAPAYPKLTYKKNKSKYVMEIMMPDLQFGRLAWIEESGDNYDIRIAARVAKMAVEQLLSYSSGYGLSQIIFTLGNDFYNVDNPDETTSHGTRQPEDTRIQKSFRAGVKLARLMIDVCVQYAPVLVPIIPGNHDEQRAFFLGEVLAGVYERQKHVTVDNEVRFRKYYQWGRNLLGYTHGYWEKLTELPLIMASERPQWWGISTNREFHVGDKHHLKTLSIRRPTLVCDDQEIDKDFNGVTVRQIRSLAGIDKWTFNKGLIGSVKSAQSFLWDDNHGVVGGFYANIDKKEYQE